MPSDSVGGWNEKSCCEMVVTTLCPWLPLCATAPALLWQSPPHPCSEHTCSSSSLSLCSCDSSCLLWSSRICMRVSRRLLCCRRIRASASSSSFRGSCTDSGEPEAKVGDSTASSCCHFKRLSSPWRILQDSPGQHPLNPAWKSPGAAHQSFAVCEA